MTSPLISVQTLQESLNEHIVIDVRFDLNKPEKGPQRYQKLHIAGAIFAHMDDVLASPITETSGRHPLPDAQHLMNWLGAHGITPDSSLVVYDDLQGAFAARLWWLLRWLGHEKVAVLDGGWQAWQDADGLMESIEPEWTPTTYQATPNDAMWLSTSGISALLTKCDAVLIDVRAAERFRGEIEPLDPVAGHIPSAVNIPLTENTTSEGFFKSPEALRKLYATSVKDKNTHICMCGSGITACQSILAMEIAGIEGTLLYAGSWSEWIRDPQRPVATV